MAVAIAMHRVLLDFIDLLSKHKNLKITVSETLKGVAMTGLGALIGGLLGGSRGLAIGGASGAAIAGITASDKYKPVAQVIKEDLNEEERAELANAVWAIIEKGAVNLVVITGVTLLNEVINNNQVEGDVVHVMQEFFNKKGMQLSC